MFITKMKSQVRFKLYFFPNFGYEIGKMGNLIQSRKQQHM